MGISVEVINKYEEFLGLEETWNRLMEETGVTHVALSFEWLKACWKSADAKTSFSTLLFKDEAGNVLGVLSLMLLREKQFGWQVRKLQFLGNENSGYAEFLFSRNRQDCFSAFIRYLKASHGQWDLLEFRNIPSDSASISLLEESSKQGKFSLRKKAGLDTPLIRINQGWQEYLAERPKKLRKALRNKQNRVKEIGLEIELFNNGNVTQKVFDAIGNISSQSWKAQIKQDFAHSKENAEFFSLLQQNAGFCFQSYIWLLRIKNTPIAYEIDLRYKDSMFALRADFCREYEKYSPGTILHAHVARYFIEQKFNSIDMGGHKDEYKMDWTTITRQHSDLFIFSHSLKGVILSKVYFNLLYPLKDMIKNIPYAKSMKSKFLRGKLI